MFELLVILYLVDQLRINKIILVLKIILKEFTRNVLY